MKVPPLPPITKLQLTILRENLADGDRRVPGNEVDPFVGVGECDDCDDQRDDEDFERHRRAFVGVGGQSIATFSATPIKLNTEILIAELSSFSQGDSFKTSLRLSKR